ncbi:TPA: hypothetical protein N0F65_004507 [Lagenidium giganteum]|uniref:Uncharacterized protein n=1 Tax=Lagenidium giganteum TaxID=4803 RepID=A0AAV2YSN1_9STRA|nr:TPA: hypothetical protein N0F65_004507 [Lagenidium giganteum]
MMMMMTTRGAIVGARVLGCQRSTAPISAACQVRLASSSVPTKLHETPVVQGCDSRWMRWLGRGSATQMYCALLFSGNMMLEAYSGGVADMANVVASAGAISSASTCAFFGAKLLCDRIVTDISACREMGQTGKHAHTRSTNPNKLTIRELVKITTLGVLSKQSFLCAPSGKATNAMAPSGNSCSHRHLMGCDMWVAIDIQHVTTDGAHSYAFSVGKRKLALDTSSAESLNLKGLELLLQGQPLVTRKHKQGKKRARDRK